MAAKIPASLRVIGRSFVDWWDSWLDMVMVTIVWFLAQLTIVLGPPATFGVYYVIYNQLNGQAYGVRGLIEGARKYFGKAWVLGALNLLVIITLVVNIRFYGGLKTAFGFYLQIFILVMAFFWYCTQFYALPYFMELDKKSLRTALRNGLFTTLAAPFFTIILMILSIVIFALSFAVMLPLFLGLPMLVPLLGFRGMYDRLIAFGIREREKTPKEIEAEQGGRIFVPEFDHSESGQDESSVGGSSAAGEDVAKGEGQVEQKE